MNIGEALEFIFRIEDIKSREDLDRWCGNMGREKLYVRVRRASPEHWERVRHPEQDVQAHYGRMLPGYANFRG